MIVGRIRKAGNSYVVTIPSREMETRGLHEGQLVGFDLAPVALRPATSPRLAPAEEADTSEDVAHEQVRREWDERLTRDIATHVVTQAELDGARTELEQGAPWAQSL